MVQCQFLLVSQFYVYIDPLSDILLQDSYMLWKRKLAGLWLFPFRSKKGENPKTMDAFFSDSQFKNIWCCCFFGMFPIFSGISSLKAAGKGTSSTKRLSFGGGGWVDSKSSASWCCWWNSTYQHFHRVAVCWHFIWNADIVVDAWCDETNIDGRDASNKSFYCPDAMDGMPTWSLIIPISSIIWPDHITQVNCIDS